MAEIAQFDHIQLNGHVIGGEPIAYTHSTQTLHIADEDWPIERWLATVRRVQGVLEHAGVAEPARARGQDPNHGSSTFLSANVRAIISRERGRLRPAPWWLGWLFDAVVTKEELADN